MEYTLYTIAIVVVALILAMFVSAGTSPKYDFTEDFVIEYDGDPDIMTELENEGGVGNDDFSEMEEEDFR